MANFFSDDFEFVTWSITPSEHSIQLVMFVAVVRWVKHLVYVHFYMQVHGKYARHIKVSSNTHLQRYQLNFVCVIIVFEHACLA